MGRENPLHLKSWFSLQITARRKVRLKENHKLKEQLTTRHFVWNGRHPWNRRLAWSVTATVKRRGHAVGHDEILSCQQLYSITITFSKETETEARGKRQRVVAAMSLTSSNDSNTYYTGSTGTRLNLFHDSYGLWVNPHSTFMIHNAHAPYFEVCALH